MMLRRHDYVSGPDLELGVPELAGELVWGKVIAKEPARVPVEAGDGFTDEVSGFSMARSGIVSRVDLRRLFSRFGLVLPGRLALGDWRAEPELISAASADAVPTAVLAPETRPSSAETARANEASWACSKPIQVVSAVPVAAARPSSVATIEIRRWEVVIGELPSVSAVILRSGDENLVARR